MGCSSEDLFIFEFIKSYYRNTNEPAKCLGGLDWHNLTKRLMNQGMSGFFYDSVSSGKVDLKLPSRVLEKWQELSGMAAMRNALYEEEGVRVLQGLENEGIDYILVKGLCLVKRLYDSSWARPVSDMDILVKREDYPRLKEYLISKGFEYLYIDNFSKMTGKEFVKAREASYNEISFFKSYGPFKLSIDIHWDMAGFVEGSPLKAIFPIDDYPWWDWRESLSIGSGKVCCLSLEAQLIQAVMHFTLNHQFMGIKWYVDICQYVYRYGRSLDWDFIRNALKEPGCRKAFSAAMKLTGEILGGTTLEESVPEDLRTGNWTEGQYRFFRRKILSERSRIEKYLCFMRLSPSFKDRQRIVSFVLFKRGAAPGSKQPLIIRPIYIAYRALRELIK